MPEKPGSSTLPAEVFCSSKDSLWQMRLYLWAMARITGLFRERKSFSLQEKLNKDIRTILDLGEVNIAAEVIVNGENAGVLWIAPFEVDITNYLKPGDNKLEIRVTNQWSNRLIWDERFPKQDGGYKLSGNPPAKDSKMPEWYVKNQPMPAGPRTTFCSGQFYKAGDDLMPSGMLGPVVVNNQKVITISN